MTVALLLANLLLVVPQSSFLIPQDHVLPVFGCGTSCRVETEQLSMPETLKDGWIRLKVRQSTWINRYDPDTGRSFDEPLTGRSGTNVETLWLFAHCRAERFAVSANPKRIDAWDQDVFYRNGPSAGQPKFQTVAANPFMRWAKLCPTEAEEGMRFIRSLQRDLRELLETQKNKK